MDEAIHKVNHIDWSIRADAMASVISGIRSMVKEVSKETFLDVTAAFRILFGRFLVEILVV